MYLLSDSRDTVLLFDHTSGVSLAPPDTADSATRSQWLTRDAAARLAVRNHLPLAKHAHFGQHKTAKVLYDAVVARCSSPATTALGRLILPYLFPKLSAFATFNVLITHLRTSDTCYLAALKAEFLDKNPPPIYITLYFIVTRLPDSLRAVRDHFLALDPTDLTVDLFEERLLVGKTSIVAVGASRGTPRTPFFEGCSPSPLYPSVASAAAVDFLGAEEAVVEAVGAVEVAVVAVGVEASVAVVVAAVGVVVVVVAAVGVVAAAVVTVGVEPFGNAVLQAARGSSSSVRARPLRPSSFVSGLLSVGRLRVLFAARTLFAQVIGLATCGKVGHLEYRCFSRFDDALRAEFNDEAELPRWRDLLRNNVNIFALDFDAILANMYALTVNAEGDCCLCVPPDPDIEAAALGASESALSSTAPAEALHTFTLDSVIARSSTVLPCPAVPSGSLSGLHLPSFSTNLVSTTALRDAMVTTNTPGGQRVTICACTQTGRHLATFTRQPGPSLYTLTTELDQVAASGQVAAPCSCRHLSHQTLLWHHRLGHPSVSRLGGMHSRLLVPGLPKSPPPLPRSPAPPCLPCVEGRELAAPHSFSLPPTDAPLQTLHMDVWGPAHVRGQDRERYFLLVVDDYSRYTIVFPLRSNGEVPDVLIPWIRAVRLQLRKRFHQDLPVLRLHSDRGGEFCAVLRLDFCHGEGILQLFTLPASPQQNGIAERRIGLVMEVARTSMIHAAAPHFLWPFAVRYAAHQLNLWPRVSLPETSPTLRWTGKVGDASVFRVWGSRAFVHNTCAYKLSSRAIPCVFLGFPPDAPSWQFYHPTSRRVLSSQDVTFDESVPFTVSSPTALPLFPPSPCRSSSLQVPLRPLVSTLVLLGVVLLGVWSLRVQSRGGAEPEGAEFGCAEPEGAEPGGAEPEGAEPGGAGSSRREPLSPQQLREWFAQRTRLRSGAAEAGAHAAGGTDAGGGGAASPGGAGGTTGAGGARGGGTGGAGADGPRGDRNGGTGAAGDGGALAGGAGAGGARAASLGGAGAARAGDAACARGAGGTGAGGPGAGGAGARGVGVGGSGAAGGAGAAGTRTGGTGGAGAGGAGAGGTAQRRPFFAPSSPSSLPPPDSMLRQVLSLLSSTGLTPPFLYPPPDQSQPRLQPASPLPAPSPYTEQTDSLTERREPASRPVRLFVLFALVPVFLVPLLLLSPALTLWHFVLPLFHSVSPCRLLLRPLFRTFRTLTSAVCRLDYATSLVAESESDCPPSVGGECALGTDVLEDRQEDFECLAAAVPHLVAMLLALEGDPDALNIPTPRSYAEAITGPYSSQWQTAMDAEMASWKSTCT
ncbi:unnamed protein product [Closterium sp. Yama58-4]|nr:unnamed protein product [Closterium sp. Yama58-4]